MSDNELAARFLDRAIGLLAEVRDEEGESIAAAASLLAGTIADGGRVFTYGAGHSALAAQDVVYRAGGLAVVNLLPVPGAVGVEAPATLGSALERVGGLAAAVLDCSPARRGDALVVISLSGRNTLPVEMARHARESGLKVVGVTSLAYASGSGPSGSCHGSGTFLKDHCDVVLDNHVPVGDTTLSTPAVGAPFAPASTVVVCALLQAVMAAVAGELADRGVEPPLLRSGNVDGGTEWNRRVMADNADRIFYRR